MYQLSRKKYRLPYHWIRDPLARDSLSYFGYLKLVLQNLPVEGRRILDAGCGDGRLAHDISQKGHEVTGIDLLDVSIGYAEQLVPEASFYVADLREDLSPILKINEESFDAVVLVEVYEHIPPDDCPVVLKNLGRLLKTGGKIIVSVPSKVLPLSRLHYRHFSEGSFVSELEQAGFFVEKMIYQHNARRFNSFLFGMRFDRFLSNRWLQPVFLKRLRKYCYDFSVNLVSKREDCGRFIAVAKKVGL
jgi:2-polyprenyl-3-methyl-5-hydroxy-6-metoxy-1,4-benzoquinol methylase